MGGKCSDKLGKDKQAGLRRSCSNCCLDHRTLMQWGVGLGAAASSMLRSEMQCVVNVCAGSS